MTTHEDLRAGLPPPVAALVDGNELGQKIGPVISVVAADAEGWPNVALLSVGEVLSVSGTDLRLVLYAGSRTTAALTYTGQALLTLVLDGTGYKIRAKVRREDNAYKDHQLAYFSGHVAQVDEDRIGYAELTSGVTFSLVDPPSVLNRWADQIERLRGISV